MKPKLYIDGQEGTTGLQIYERLGARDDIELLRIDPDKRKDTAERKRLLNAADLVFLCLPDAAAVEAVALIENENTRVVDASTAHRTAPSGSGSGTPNGWPTPAVTPPAFCLPPPPWWPWGSCPPTIRWPATLSPATPAAAGR